MRMTVMITKRAGNTSVARLSDHNRGNPLSITNVGTSMPENITCIRNIKGAMLSWYILQYRCESRPLLKSKHPVNGTRIRADEF